MRCVVPLLVAGLVVGGAVEAAAQPVPGAWVVRESPRRELNVSASLWSLFNSAEGSSVGATYTRNLSDYFGLEARFDVARAEHRPFGVLNLQARAARLGRPGFLTVGFTHALSSRSHPSAPRHNGFSAGLGALFPLTHDLAFRLDGQVLLYKNNRGALRITAGVTFAAD